MATSLIPVLGGWRQAGISLTGERKYGSKGMFMAFTLRIRRDRILPLWFEDSVKVRTSDCLLCFSDSLALTPVSDTRFSLLRSIRIPAKRAYDFSLMREVDGNNRCSKKKLQTFYESPAFIIVGD